MRKLVKLVKEESHAQMLLDGNLFMRPAGYYHHREIGQGDRLEGIITLDEPIYSKAECPIYCMCSFCDNEIVNGCLYISKQCIEDFDCSNGYAVVLDWDKFEERLPSLDCNGHKCLYRRVEYKVSLGLNDYLDIIESENKGDMKSLFIKHPYFAHQKEYRIAVADPHWDGIMPDNDVSVIYKFPNSLEDIGYSISIPKYLSSDGSLHIPICDLG